MLHETIRHAVVEWCPNYAAMVPSENAHFGSSVKEFRIVLVYLNTVHRNIR